MIAPALLPVLFMASPLQPAEALLGDLEKLVFLREQQGWKIDRYDVESLMPDALLSMCRVPVEQRQQASWELDRRLKAMGAPLDSAYQNAGKTLRGLERLLRLTRVRLLFDVARTQAATDCPVYIEPNHQFAGEQIHPGRWSLGTEGGGVFGAVGVVGVAVGVVAVVVVGGVGTVVGVFATVGLRVVVCVVVVVGGGVVRVGG